MSLQRTGGFAMQTFFIGIGGIVASWLPYIMTNWLDISNTAPPGVVPDSVKWSFYAGGAAFLLAVSWTVLRTREYSPQELAEFDAGSQEGGVRLVLSRDELVELVRVFLPDTSNEVRLIDRIDSDINKVVELGFHRGHDGGHGPVHHGLVVRGLALVGPQHRDLLMT